MSTRQSRNHANHERWLVSYADFITLLFAFFVVLYAFAKADQKKHLELTASVDSAFRNLGLFPSSVPSPRSGAGSPSATEAAIIPMNIVMGEQVLSPTQVRDALDKMQRQLEQTLSNQVAMHTVSIHMGREGLVISLREAGFFTSGSAIPKADTLSTVRQIAASLKQMPFDLRIEGHTDNQPIHTAEFDSNWDLSSARATHIARLFLTLQSIRPERISTAGYAEFHPVARNDTEQGRAENRRVDLVVLPRTKLDLSNLPLAHKAGAWRKLTDAP
jgi:chemotaxis protein MotB